MEVAQLVEKFKMLYAGEGEIRVFFAPGRVNLIGEHIDYNGGYVFPCAIDMGTYAIVRKRADNLIRFASLNFPLKAEISIDNIVYDEKDDWINYPKGVVKEFLQNGYQFSGLDILYYGNLPNGAGLSSSASIELVTAIVLKEIFSLRADNIKIVKMAQSAENNFVGVNCGIMDQFAIGMGKKEKAILLDCNTLDYLYAPLKLGEYKIVIANTNKRRGLADSKYNERRAECNSALEKLKKKKAIKNLCDLTCEEFEMFKSVLSDENEIKRARHAVYENQRTKEGFKKLQEGDLEGFGQLMKASHKSLKEDYEVTGEELDILVEEAWKQEGVIGARMTGAGFGGCSVNIVRNDKIDEFIENVGERYRKKIKTRAEFYVVTASRGAEEIKKGDDNKWE